jgi:ribonuclease-3
MGRAEEAQGGRSRDSTLADAMESIIGAVYLDGGLDATRTFLLNLVEEELKEVLANPDEINPKGKLQELLQGLGTPPPDYTTLSMEGPDHLKLFHVVVSVNDTPLGEGRGRSKKEAEIEAAKSATDGAPLKKMLAELKRGAAAQ